ncbi:hypothetical protein NDU88_012561 [Pleurodeles waltl]|uniref:Uncharacterized protein n=1 Tax=Pleurodeles waltl TaxID=8319 RepID=A0AAV7R6A9_PLEWA|nr:hypothetical protein NDU88_012561 [Pleurodeles waltl]
MGIPAIQDQLWEYRQYKTSYGNTGNTRPAMGIPAIQDQLWEYRQYKTSYGNTGNIRPAMGILNVQEQLKDQRQPHTTPGDGNSSKTRAVQEPAITSLRGPGTRNTNN